ncbi:MAG: hypothetical protein U9P72_05840 [Campylobacterota bacterium]|nr:hypothetical protein [Campylobacterota bacterium]
MIRLLFLSFIFIATLFANETNSTDENLSAIEVPKQKVLYLNFKDIPSRVLKGEIFSITLKTLSTIKNFQDISYEFTNYSGVKPLTEVPYREETDKYYYDTFYFLTTAKYAKIPDVTASLVTEDEQNYKKTTLLGSKINVVTLNPKKEFTGIIADLFEITDYKTTSFDQLHNIIVFSAKAEKSDLSTFNLNNVYKQGIESITESINLSKITYYAVINKDIENFVFSYFNLKQNRFITINIPIIVDDDSVTTQTDLKPKDQSKEKLKMGIAGVVALVGFIFIIWRKKYIYLFFIIIPLVYIGYIAIPSKSICIKKGSKIHLLPVYNGTIFETTQSEYNLLQEGNIKNFTKVKLHNEKIGWVKNEDICSY